MNPKKQDNLLRALQSLEEAIAEPVRTQRDMAGIIQNFEFVYELSWKFLKAYLEDEGVQSSSPKDVLTKAWQNQLIQEEAVWLDILLSRNLSVHTYDEDLARQLVDKIKNQYITAFRALKTLAENKR